MEVDLSQYVDGALYLLEREKRALTIPLICKSLEVTPHTAKMQSDKRVDCK